MSNKKQLHSSHLDTYWWCAYRFYLRWIEEIIVPPNFITAKRFATGTGTHGGVEVNLKHKIETGELLLVDQVRDAARDATNAAWDKNGVRPLKEEKKLSEKVVRGEAVDMAISLATLHHVELAPKINPVAVERKWVVEVPGWPYDLGGTIDTDEGSKIIDLKTKNKSPGKRDADDMEQMTVYSLAKKVLDDIYPEIEIHYLVKNKKPIHMIQTTTRDEQDHKIFLEKYKAVILAIKTGSFPPTSQKNWWCSLENCGYAADHCKYYRRRK